MLKKLKSAQEALKTLVLESTSERIQRASRTLADSPIPTYLGPGNIGFGVTVGSEPSANFFAFTCARYGRAREEGWTGSAESSYLPRLCVSQAPPDEGVQGAIHLLPVRCDSLWGMEKRAGPRLHAVPWLLGRAIHLRVRQQQLIDMVPHTRAERRSARMSQIPP